MANRIYLHPDGWRVSKPGINAITNTNPRNFLFDTGYADTIPVASAATAVISASSTQNVNIPVNGSISGYVFNYFSNAEGKVYSGGVPSVLGGQDLAFINGRDLCMSFYTDFWSFDTGPLFSQMGCIYLGIFSGNWRFSVINPWAQNITLKLLVFSTASK